MIVDHLKPPCEAHFENDPECLDCMAILAKRILAYKRFVEKILVEDSGCHIWTAGLNQDGYAQFSDENVRTDEAHRWIFEFEVGRIPEGLTIHHHCEVRNCVNVAHLEPMSLVGNSMLSSNPMAINARKTHCINGHEFTESNTYYITNPNGNPGRQCKACRDARAMKLYEPVRMAAEQRRAEREAKRGTLCSEEGCSRMSNLSVADGMCAICRHAKKENPNHKPSPTRQVPKGTTLEEKFFRKAVGSEDPDACWIWEGGKTSEGRGLFNVGPTKVSAIKWAYEHLVGEVPGRTRFVNTCGEISCVNPEHYDLIEGNTRGPLRKGAAQ